MGHPPDLKQHEETHVDIAIHGAQDLHDAVNGTSASGTGKTPAESQKKAADNLAKKVDANAAAAVKATMRKEEDPDDRTAHGTKPDTQKHDANPP